MDVFLSDLRRLARLAGVENEALIRCAFVCGLPSDVSSTLRAAARINTAELAAIAEHARVLMSERLHGGAMVAINKTRKILPVENRPRGKLQCYGCGGDHPVKYCKVRKPLTCWTCGESDHISRQCTTRVSKNGQGKLPASAAYPHM